MVTNPQAKQRIVGYLMVALAVVVSGWVAWREFQGEVGSPLVAVPIVLFLLILAYRSLRATKQGRVIADERSTELIRSASAQSFWFLVFVILLDMSLNLISPDFQASIYLLTGMGSLSNLLDLLSYHWS